MATSSIHNQRFEVVLLGEYTMGKTSLIRRINGDDFLDEPTVPDFINVEYRFRVSDTLNQNLVVRFSDTGGMENWGNLPTNLFRNKDGIILTWDISDTNTYRHLDRWEEVISHNYHSSRMPTVIVVANKSDKPHSPETYKCCVEKYKKKGITCFKTSAKSGENVKEAFHKLVSLMVETRQHKDRVPMESIRLNKVPDHPIEEPRRSCC